LIRRTLALGALLAIAGVLGYESYGALASHPRRADNWDRAIATARQADRTKAVVLAVRRREQAIALFDRLSVEGSPQARSRAAMLAGLLDVRNAGDQTDAKLGLRLAVGEFQRAVRLDRSNEDAAYDLELLLSKSVQAGRPLRPATSSELQQQQQSKGTPGSSPPGTGY